MLWRMPEYGWLLPELSFSDRWSRERSSGNEIDLLLDKEDTQRSNKGIADMYGPANDPSTANDPQIGPQMIPRPEMIPANGVAKNRE